QLFPKTAHVGERGAVRPAIETQDAILAARIEVQAHALAKPDERLGKIDPRIENAAKRGAASTIVGQRKAHQVLAGGRQCQPSSWAPLEGEGAAWSAKRRQIEADAGAPLCPVAEPIDADPDGGWAIRWLLALMVLCCDPPAKTLTSVESARKR